MATVSDLVTAALQRLGVLDATETVSSDDSAYALSTLNLWIDQLATQRLAIFTITRSTWTISANDGSYTVGSGGDVNITRPVYVESVAYRDTALTTPIEVPLIPLTDDAYALITTKTQTSNYPSSYYYNPTYGSTARGTLELYPVPTSSTLQGVIYTPTAVSEFAALTTTVSLPPGYRQMIVTNLALQMAPAYKVRDTRTLETQAKEALGWVKRANQRMLDMWIDSGALGDGGRRPGTYSIYQGP